MFRLVLTVDDRVRYLPIPTEPAVVGSDAACGIVLRARGVSRRHARIEPGKCGARVIDLGSKNGLEVDGNRLTRIDLAPGSHVRLGTAWLGLEEISTADGELGIQMSSPSRQSHAVAAPSETEDPHSTDAADPAQALRLVRELQARASQSVTTDRTLLEHARAVLRAHGLFAFTVVEQDLALVQSVGAVPEAAVLERASELAQGEVTAGTELRRADSYGLLVAPLATDGPATHLAAWWAPDTNPVDWHREFLACLAEAGGELEPVTQSRPAAEEKLHFPPGTIFGSSPAMAQLLATIQQTLDSGLDVLLTGDTGTGKELFARMIHLSGTNPEGPFIPVNCPGIPEELQEAEFFGIERNVATGVDRRRGYFALADGGTLFLDEIGDMPLPLQAKLLRVLQEREFLPVGGSEPRRVNLRVVASSNKDLRLAVAQGRFRPDLYFRLRQLQFHLPLLAERQEDIPALALEFVQRAATEYGKRIRGLSRKALRVLAAHDWPGNVRELEYTIHHAVAAAPDGGAIESRHLEQHLGQVGSLLAQRSDDPTTSPSPEAAGLRPGRDLVPTTAPLPTLDLDALERTALRQALIEAGGNKSQAARLLGISRAGLYKKMERLERNHETRGPADGDE